MSPREQFDRELKELHSNVIEMGLLVTNQLDTALKALDTLDPLLAKQIMAMDQQVNTARNDIENFCFKLIVTQQPAARDLRAIFAAMNIIVDLERIGDKAKDIAETIPHILRAPSQPRPGKLTRMGNLVKQMLELGLRAYTSSDIELAKQVAALDGELVKLFDDILDSAIDDLAKAKKGKKVTATFAILRAAQHIERVGDLTTNVAERIIYLVTGNLEDMKAHIHDTVD